MGVDEEILAIIQARGFNDWGSVIATLEAHDQKQAENKMDKDYMDINPRSIKLMLDRDVIGQDRAKKQLAVAAYKHLVRIAANRNNKPLPSKSNVLLVGNTGTGKTFLCEKLAEILGIPFAIVDASTITSSGYVGDDVNIIAERILASADGNKRRAEFGIVFIDEVDKLASSNGGDIATTSVQYELLKVIEGRTLATSSKATASGESIETKNILFIAGGAFGGKITEKRTDIEKSVGFGGGEKEKIVPMNDQLIEYGLLPEFVGRFHGGACLNDLSVDDLVKILKESNSSYIKNMENLFAMEGKSIVFTEGAIREIATLAHAKKTGARALLGVLELALNELQYEVLGTQGDKEIRITKSFIKGAV
jgi:ATP-dependent Clp protease ATP-binding subunit ClpX